MWLLPATLYRQPVWYFALVAPTWFRCYLSVQEANAWCLSQVFGSKRALSVLLARLCAKHPIASFTKLSCECCEMNSGLCRHPLVSQLQAEAQCYSFHAADEWKPYRLPPSGHISRVPRGRELGLGIR